MDGQTPRRFQRQDVLVLVLGFLYDFSNAFTSSLGTAYNLAAMHANYTADLADFRQQVALDIETLSTGDDTDE